MKRAFYIAAMVWLLLMGLSFYWNYTKLKSEQHQIALEAASSFFEQIVTTRAWNAGHGSVYVPVTKQTQPNPFLLGPDRDIKVNDSLVLTKVNPAYMTRQISEIAQESQGVQFHITSLNPIRPQNMPTPREEKALQSFERGVLRVGEIYSSGSGNRFFFMAPLLTTKACLSCHAKQGYEVGDIRGGISVSLPFVPRVPITALLLGHLVIGIVGGLGILYMGSRLNRAYAVIHQQAIMDALTGIPNRRSFTETLLKEFARSKRDVIPFSILMCDIDNFKGYNDTYGHAAGDECLRRVAQSIDQSLKRPTDFCARYGGEEFVVILPGTALEGAEHVAEGIRVSLEQKAIPHTGSPPFNVVTLSLGVASLTKGEELSHEDLISRADQALYQAKRMGRNRVQVFR